MSSLSIKSEDIIIEDGNDYASDDGEEGIRLTFEDSGGETYHYQQRASTSPRQHHTVVTVPHGGTQSVTGSSIVIQPRILMENEKRMRREIANSNERRRMQSINAGFQSLRSLLPHHEGEKLSKAAILQQTAQYIIDLEREKTHLLSQNSQLKRLLGQHEIGSGGGGGATTSVADGTVSATIAGLKKRKLTDNVIALQTISDSSDEGLGSMSPEPVTLLANASANANKLQTIVNHPTQPTTTTYISTSVKEMTDLKSRLENERKQRALLEDRLRQLERQIYPSSQYIQREVIEHTDNLREEEVALVEIDDDVPTIVGPQVVVCSSIEPMHEDDTEILEEINIREEVILSDDHDHETAEYVEVPSRLQPILEAAIKAEPKVEVERINETLSKLQKESKDGSKPTSGTMYLTSTSRQNLETIVEAIRHLEGDHMFSDVAEQHKKASQEAPLALTTTKQPPQQQRKLKAELSPFIQLKNGTVTIVTAAKNLSSNSNKISSSLSQSSLKTSSSSSASTPTTIIKVEPAPSAETAAVVSTSTSLKQCRPGVIVAKQLS